MKRFYRVSAALLATAVLSACGGGSGSEAGSTTSYAVGTAWANLYASAHTWSLSGSTTWTPANSSSAYTYPTTATLAMAKVADAVFPYNGINAHVLRSTLSVTAAGSTDISSLDQYLDANLTYMGSVDSSDGSCEVATQSNPLPSWAYLGDNQVLAQFTVYDSCNAGASVLSTGTTRWSLELQAGQPFFCLSTDTAYNGGSDSEKDCVAVDPAGTIGTTARITGSSVSTAGVGAVSLTTP